MSIQTKTKQIDGYTIETTQFAARKQLEYQFRLGKYIGGSIGQLASLISKFDRSKELSEQTIDGNSLSSVFESLFSKNDSAEITDFILQLFSNTKINGHDLNESYMTVELTGKLPTIYKILFFVLEVNYESFLEPIKSQFKKLTIITKT